ncbi:hypothetical protein [Streptomyces sp. NPDC020917]|uniref:hypothetical protein n=1 Tax=Streptomyces sp. NPDC020917 TaxID=3365102 RepID=UPI00378F165B
MSRRRLRGVLAGALGLALGTAAVVAGAGTADADSAATTATSGTVTLVARGSALTDTSPFAQVSVDRACPANYRDALNVSVVVPDGRESLLASHLTSGAPYATAPVTADVPAATGNGTIVRSIATAFALVHVPVADGTYPIHVTCANADRTAFTEHPTFTGFIDITGSTWQVSSRPAPAATKVKLSASPANHVQVGQPFTLTAKVAAGVPGTVQFEADNGVTVVGAPVPVVNGTASIQPPVNTVVNVRQYIAVFTPADQLAYAQDYETLDYAFVDAPSVTVTDAGGNTLGDTPQLTFGQTVTVSARGFRPAGGEKVDVAVTNVYGPLPAVLASTASNSAGVVADYALTVPRNICAGTHKAVLVGEQTLVAITFTFTTK